MTQADNEAFVKYLIQYKKSIPKDKDAAKKFIKKLDNFTETGKLSKSRKQVCTQPDRG